MNSRYEDILKRIIDIGFSLCGLIVVSPIFAGTSLFIYITSGRPIFFTHKRVGKDGRIIGIYKFRTMVRDAEKMGPQVTASDDPRITPFGRILRKTKLDELPQLINVLTGDLSLVGPRPEAPKYVELFKNEYKDILKVKPGLTDPATIEFIDEQSLLSGSENPEEMYIKKILPQKIKLYKQYIENQSIILDFFILFKTLLRLFRFN